MSMSDVQRLHALLPGRDRAGHDGTTAPLPELAIAADPILKSNCLDMQRRTDRQFVLQLPRGLTFPVLVPPLACGSRSSFGGKQRARALGSRRLKLFPDRDELRR